MTLFDTPRLTRIDLYWPFLQCDNVVRTVPCEKNEKTNEVFCGTDVCEFTQCKRAGARDTENKTQVKCMCN